MAATSSGQPPSLNEEYRRVFVNFSDSDGFIDSTHLWDMARVLGEKLEEEDVQDFRKFAEKRNDSDRLNFEATMDWWNSDHEFENQHKILVDLLHKNDMLFSESIEILENKCTLEAARSGEDINQPTTPTSQKDKIEIKDDVNPKDEEEEANKVQQTTIPTTRSETKDGVNLRDEEEAATKLQPTTASTENGETKDDGNPTDQKEAAIKLQSTVRGHLGRRRAMRHKEDVYSGLRENGSAFLESGDWNAAEKAYTRCIQLHKDERLHMDYTNRSICRFELGLYEDALADAKKSVELNPTWIKGYLYQGQALAELHRYIDARNVCEAGLALAKSGAGGIDNDLVDDFEEELASLDEIAHLEKEIGNSDLYTKFNQNGQKALLNEEWENAISFYDKCIEIGGKERKHLDYSNRSMCYFELEKYEDAIADAAKSVELEPNWIKGYLYQAHAYTAMGRLIEARNVCKKGYALARSGVGKNSSGFVESLEFELNHLDELIEEKEEAEEMARLEKEAEEKARLEKEAE
eukprot:g5033.t1